MSLSYFSDENCLTICLDLSPDQQEWQTIDPSSAVARKGYLSGGSRYLLLDFAPSYKRQVGMDALIRMGSSRQQ